ncbi:DeoR family transcriptional regulator [Enterobacter sp. BIGb0383]|uniref:DeoR/GlpR family DNA-binding transcription regulator n=1 Tax=unclassified Enterobacter TaxID=2608935 RepID=UPI000F49535D|nr:MULTISPECIES: DeoR/GlpR family DNA-binding transcription regulator [unclassified Enterobacter]ROP48916.1 DeoR family transcriptional regulator [Enterobacter sp. BIGb0383]ROS00492.1 DeoR family transcriptional regulator [Enterobacter sp. BIGb0359]
MTPETRRSAIVALVTERGETSIEALSHHFGVSLQTVRSDLRDLTTQGLLLRRHGMVATFARENIGYQQREIVNINGKRWIGERTAQLLSEAQSCFLGTGTTVEMVARALPETASLAAFTNNLHAALPLSHLTGCELTVAGGRIRKRDLDIIGSDALTFFSRYRVDVGVVSVGGIGESGELYDFNDDEVLARQALIASADLTVLVVDSTKFGRTALCRNGCVGDFDYVVSDRAPTDRQQAMLSRRQTQWLCRDRAKKL